MANNWKHYYGDDDGDTNEKYNGGAYSFYDFDDEEVRAMEKDRMQDMREAERDKRISDLEKRKPQQAPAAKKAPAKPGVPKEQSQKIDPVTASPEIAQAKSKVQEYQKKDYSSIFQQNDTDFTSQFQPSASQDTPSGAPQKDPQQFADKYKLDLSKSGATKQMDTTASNPMTGADILKNDKQQYGSYM